MNKEKDFALVTVVRSTPSMMFGWLYFSILSLLGTLNIRGISPNKVCRLKHVHYSFLTHILPIFEPKPELNRSEDWLTLLTSN